MKTLNLEAVEFLLANKTWLVLKKFYSSDLDYLANLHIDHYVGGYWHKTGHAETLEVKVYDFIQAYSVADELTRRNLSIMLRNQL